MNLLLFALHPPVNDTLPYLDHLHDSDAKFSSLAHSDSCVQMCELIAKLQQQHIMAAVQCKTGIYNQHQG